MVLVRNGDSIPNRGSATVLSFLRLLSFSACAARTCIPGANVEIWRRTLTLPNTAVLHVGSCQHGRRQGGQALKIVSAIDTAQSHMFLSMVSCLGCKLLIILCWPFSFCFVVEVPSTCRAGEASASYGAGQRTLI